MAGSTRHTRASLERAANQIAHHLTAHRIEPGERVGIYSRNRAEYVEALLGCWKCGAIPVNINWRYVANELQYVVNDAELVTVIVEDEFLPILDAVGFAPRTRLGEWHDASTARAFDAIPRSPDDVYMLYTGGTTGMPKGVMWRHEDFFYACCLGGSPLDPIKTPSEITRNATPAFQMSPLALGPLMHGGGQWLTLIALYGGNRAVVYCERSFDAEAVLDLAERERVSTMGIIGDAMARPLAEAVLAEPARWDLSSIFGLGNGGATDKNGVRWVVPAGRHGDDRCRRSHRVVRARFGMHQYRRREGVPRRSRPRFAHPDVLDAVVVGRPDDRFGQRVVALVALRPDATELTLEALQSHCRTLIAGYKVPRALLVGAAPRTNTGKPDYATAQQLASSL